MGANNEKYETFQTIFGFRTKKWQKRSHEECIRIDYIWDMGKRFIALPLDFGNRHIAI